MARGRMLPSRAPQLAMNSTRLDGAYGRGSCFLRHKTRTPVIPLRGLRRITFFFRWAGFTCGTLDICAALIVYQHFGRPPMRLLQGIAAGADLDHGDAERIH